VTAERALLFALGGGCMVPIGALATVADAELTLRGAVLEPTGKERIEGAVCGPATAAQELGRRLAGQLQAQGAGRLLAAGRPG
jgi:hydroxymethylbilane synthase